MRSNATTGSPKNWYSITLFIVLRSDHELLGTGSTPMSAEERIRQSSSSLTTPVKVVRSSSRARLPTRMTRRGWYRHR